MRILLLTSTFLFLGIGGCTTTVDLNDYIQPRTNQYEYNTDQYRRPEQRSNRLPFGYYFDTDGIVRDSAGEVKTRQTCRYYGASSDQCFLAVKRETESSTRYLNRKRHEGYTRWREYCEPRNSCGEDRKRQFFDWWNRRGGR